MLCFPKAVIYYEVVPLMPFLEQFEVKSLGDHSHRHYSVMGGGQPFEGNYFQILFKEVKNK